MRKLKSYQTEYKRAIIEPSIYSGYEWYHPDYVDADWTGDGWTTFGCGTNKTIQDCKDDIDEFLEELEPTK